MMLSTPVVLHWVRHNSLFLCNFIYRHHKVEYPNPLYNFTQMIFLKSILKNHFVYKINTLNNYLYFSDELDLPDGFPTVFIKHHNCYEQIEKLYYACGYEDICIHYSRDTDLVKSDGYYPQCTDCAGEGKQKIPMRRR